MCAPGSVHMGMENWGLIIMEPNLLTSIEDQTKNIYHELIHQWFGNYVSPKGWKWLWLNEGITKYLEHYFVNKAHPDWKDIYARFYEAHEVMTTDGGIKSTYVMESEMQTTGKAPESWFYSKGFLLVRMMHMMMGDTAFFVGLNHYLVKYNYSNANSSDFFRILDQAPRTKRCKDKKIFSTRMPDWFSQPGLPMVVVNKTASGYNLTQRRFVTDSNKGTDQYTWDIPIAFKKLGEDKQHFKACSDRFWLRKGHSTEIRSRSSSPIIFNYDQMAYCRVLYDTASYNGLIDQLDRDHKVISPISRGMILNDALAFYENDQLELSVVLRIVDYLKSELELLPWKYFEQWFLKNAFLRFTDLKEKLENRMRLLMRKPYQELRIRSIHTVENWPLSEIVMRQAVEQVACYHGLDECVEEARKTFRKWKRDGFSESFVYFFHHQMQLCTVMAYGTDDDWQYMLNRSIADKGDLFRGFVFYTSILGCSRNHQHLEKLLNMCLNGAWEKLNIDTCLSDVILKTDITGYLDKVFDFILKHSERLKDSLSSWTFLLFGKRFHSEAFLKTKMPELKVKFNNSDGVIEMEEQIRKNHAWMNAHYHTFETWLNENRE